MNNFYAGGDSGFSALQYAIAKGYHKIYLVGYDMVVQGDNHYHNWYSRKTSSFQKKLDRYFRLYKKAFSEINKWKDVKVFSCSPISKLNEFVPYVDLNKVLR